MIKEEMENLFCRIIGAVLTVIVGMLLAVYLIMFGILRFITSFKYTHKLHDLIAEMDVSIEDAMVKFYNHLSLGE